MLTDCPESTSSTYILYLYPFITVTYIPSFIMEKHPAVLALKPGCECRLNPEVSHWPELALELIHFLRLKRLYGDRVGCSGDVEKLWRYMLLDADEAENVYRLLGGPVPHSRKPSPVSTQVLAINMLVRVTARWS